MVDIFFSTYPPDSDEIILQNILYQLPSIVTKKIRGFSNRKKAWQQLIGKFLLQSALQQMGLANLISRLSYQPNGKPFISDEIDFNISHSEGISICAISKVVKVGIDIEKIRFIDIFDFEEQFTKNEWEKILAFAEREKEFFTCWTKKESILKATGLGLSYPLKKINSEEPFWEWGQKKWYAKQIEIDSPYIAFLATDHPNPIISLKKLELTNT